MEFLDRTKDIERLRKALERERRQFIVLYGRRRVGKSTLLKEVLDTDGRDIYFLADQTAESNQRQRFAQIAATKINGFDLANYPSWEALLISLNERTDERFTLCIDEFPYLVKSCPSLPSVIQRLLESANLRYDLVICGSAQQLMHGYVMKRDEPLYGRADEIIRLAPIPPAYLCKALNCNADEAIQEYAVWGGIPRYWELRKDYLDMKSAIDNLLLDPHGILYEEPYRLLHDEMRDTVQASTLLSIIGNGANKMSEIAARAEKAATEISAQLNKLSDLGFIIRQLPYGEDEKKSRKGIYVVSDHLFRFHYRFVSPYISFIELGKQDVIHSVIESQFSQYVGQFWEELCRDFVCGNMIDNILYTKGSRWWGMLTDGTMAELDVVAESLDRKHLLIGECKWTRKENTEALTKRLNDIAGKLPFAKRGQTVHTCLFLRTQPDTPVSTAYFTPEDMLDKGF